MISTKKLIKMARKWQKLAMVRQRKRVSFPSVKHEEANSSENCSTSGVVDKGHFVVYSVDQRRFVIPLAYLNKDIFRKLLEIAEEEFGLPNDGPLVLPCDSIFVEYIISLIHRGVAADLHQEALLISVVTTSHCSSSSSLILPDHQGYWGISQHLTVH